MSHYWAANEDPRLRAALAGDWLADLREFPAEMVADACQVWRRTQAKRPTVADIRGLCISAQEDKRAMDRLPALPAPDTAEVAAEKMDWPRRYAEAAEARERWAQQQGCRDFREAIATGLQSVAKRAPQ